MEVLPRVMYSSSSADAKPQGREKNPTIAFSYRPPTEEDVHKWRVQTFILYFKVFIWNKNLQKIESVKLLF